MSLIAMCMDFEPVGSGTALYRGTVWIDRATFARVRVQTVQSGLPAPVVSNEETQHYTPVASVGGRPVFLFTRMSARQILMVAGRNVLVEKSVAFTNVQVNQPEFAAARDAARASNRVMYKETDQGLRHYIKEGEVRVVSNRAEQQRQGDGDGRDDRSVVRISRCRFSASTISTSNSAALTRSSRCCLAACSPREISSAPNSGPRRWMPVSTSLRLRRRLPIASMGPMGSARTSAC